MAEYRDKSIIGAGGFAEVWYSERSPDGQIFAKKVLFTSAGRLMVERFQQEVRILAKLDHPNIIKVVDSQLATPPFWYVMPRYLTSLRDELPRVIGNEVRIQKILRAILDAVEYAHKEGVIHRDLKPHNVMMNGDDEVVVTDFGIGRVLDAEGDRFTHTGQRMGSVPYASPEQFTDAKNVDFRSDIYSLGRMLYELYTERLNSSVQSLSRLPSNIAPIVERCTRQRREDRFQSVSELKDAWRSANGVTSLDGGLGEAKRLVAELVATPTLESKVGRLLQLLAENDHNQDLLRDALMQIPPISVALMLSIDPDRLRKLVHLFVEHVMAQSWGISYLDKLGARCGNLFMAVHDPTIRSELLYCNLFIGAKERRYAVLDTLAQLLQSVHEHNEVRAIQERLEAAPNDVRSEAGKWLELDELDPKLAGLFRC